MCFGPESWIINPGVGRRGFFHGHCVFKSSEFEVNHDSDCDFGGVKVQGLMLALVTRR